MQDTEIRWYILRLPYGKEMEISKFFELQGVESFLPVRYVGFRENRHLVPVSSNLFMVHASKARLDEIKQMTEAKDARYMMDATSGKPYELEDAVANNFIKVASQLNLGAVFLDPKRDGVKEGPKVRVTDGPFEGVFGEYLRVRSNRCVVVRLLNLATVATGFVKPDSLEHLD